MDNAGNEVYRVSGIVRLPEGWDFSMCIRDRYLIIFFTYDIKKILFIIRQFFHFDILRRITSFPESHSVFFAVTFNVACELSQPMGKTE